MSHFQHDRIQAWVGEAVLHRFDETFVEGKVYEIKNFVVKYYESTEIQQSFNADKYIILSHLTQVIKLNENHSKIPMHVWKFIDLAVVPTLDYNTYHFVGNIQCLTTKLRII